ncbi:hypothetical protein [Streptomyces sp. NPDC127066]|uniref:hypothetical protein n=1 Tax=Streptomyces sp. NPDC127066 TaxID=3347125 RepID=UPI0036549A01
MTASPVMSMRTYLDEIRYAVEHIMPTLWHERDELRDLERQVKAAAARAAEEYSRAQFIMMNSEDSEDFMMGVGAHWDSYWGPDKNRHYMSQEAEQLRARLAARSFSTSALAGALLQYGKQCLSAAYGPYEKNKNPWPTGRMIASQSTSTIIRCGRNQALHWEEGKLLKDTAACFDVLVGHNTVFGECCDRSLALEVIELLGWRNYNDFERELLDIDAARENSNS